MPDASCADSFFWFHGNKKAYAQHLTICSGLQQFRITLNTNGNKLSKLNHNRVIQSKTGADIALKDDAPSGEALHLARQ